MVWHVSVLRGTSTWLTESQSHILHTSTQMPLKHCSFLLPVTDDTKNTHCWQLLHTKHANESLWFLEFPARKRAVWGVIIAQTDHKRSKIRYKIKLLWKELGAITKFLHCTVTCHLKYVNPCPNDWSSLTLTSQKTADSPTYMKT